MELKGHDQADTFRVSVSLARYFSDERALCLMQVRGSRCAGWLARRLRRTFELPARPALLCRGHLLPPGEPLAMLCPDDALEAIPSSASVADLSRTRSPVADAGEEDEGGEGAAGAVGTCLKRRRTERAEPSAPSPPPMADSFAESLNEMKRRALDLLEEHETRVPRRRRRVRRRRNPASSPRPGLEEEHVALEPENGAVEVIRNESERQRAPRRVSALSPAPTPTPDAPLAPPAPQLASD